MGLPGIFCFSVVGRRPAVYCIFIKNAFEPTKPSLGSSCPIQVRRRVRERAGNWGSFLYFARNSQ